MINLSHPTCPNVDEEGVTGHTLRRSGIKALGRRGVPFSAIQWLARHSSNTTMLYLEQAMEECPQAQFTMLEAVSVGEKLTSLATRYDTLERALHETEAELKEGLAKISGREVPFLDRNALRREMRAAMIPFAVFNPETNKVHAVNANSCFHESATLWTTKCGWAWIRSGSTARPIFDEIELEPLTATKCSKCFDVQTLEICRLRD